MDFQVNIMTLIQSFHTPLLDAFFVFITNLGSEAFYFLLIPLFYWSLDKKLGLRMAVSLLLSIYLNTILKEITAIPRPIGHPGIRSLFLISAQGYSFPSGHAQGSTTIWYTLMKSKKPRAALVVTGVVIIFLVSLSRLYLGVHWPLDVVAGIGLGVVIVSLMAKTENIKFPKSLSLRLALSILLPLLMLLIFPHKDVFKYTGMLSGILIGYNLEKEHIHFEPTKRDLKQKAPMYFIAALGFAVIYFGLKFLPPNNIASMIRYFFLGLWLTLGIPYLAKYHL